VLFHISGKFDQVTVQRIPLADLGVPNAGLKILLYFKAATKVKNTILL